MENQTEGARDLEFVLSEAEFGRSYDEGVIASGQGVVEPGTTLHIVGSNFEVAAAADTATHLLAYGVDATSAAARCVVLARAAQVKGVELKYASDVTTDAHRATKAAQLAARGIIVR